MLILSSLGKYTYLGFFPCEKEVATNLLKNTAHIVFFKPFYQETSYKLSESMPVSGSLCVCENSLSKIPSAAVERATFYVSEGCASWEEVRLKERARVGGALQGRLPPVSWLGNPSRC